MKKQLLAGATRRVRFVNGAEFEFVWEGGSNNFLLRSISPNWKDFVEVECTVGELLGLAQEICLFAKEVVE